MPKQEEFEIYIDLNSTALGRRQRIVQHNDICYLESIRSMAQPQTDGEDDMYQEMTACPLQNGPYSFYTSFTVPSYSNDAVFEFTPDLRIEFFDSDNDQIGCVETGTLAEISARKELEEKGQRAFVIVFLFFCLAISFCMMGHRRHRKRGERAEMKRQASMMRRFHYIRTTRSGDSSIHPSLTTSFSYGSNSSQPIPTRSPPRNMTQKEVEIA